MIILNAVLSLLLSFLLSPVTLLVAGLVGILAVLAKVVKVPFAVSLWGILEAAFNQAVNDVKNNAHAYIVIGVVALFFPQYAAIGALAYIVASKLGLKVP